MKIIRFTAVSAVWLLLGILSPVKAQDLREGRRLSLIADSLFRAHAYEQALEASKKSYEIHRTILGENHPDNAVPLSNLAIITGAMGQHAEAESLYFKLLAIREKDPGPGHPEFAAVLYNLAVLYFHQGRYNEAGSLYERALRIREETLGPDHPDVAASLNSLAALRYEQSEYDEAETLFRQALAIREKNLGTDHIFVANTIDNLAVVLDATGRYSDTESLYRRALAIREKNVGPEHPETAGSLNNLAGLYESLGRYDEAEPLYSRALAIREKNPGPDHPETAASLNNLGALYEAQGRYAEAEPLYIRALHILETVLGSGHPALADCLNNLAGLYDTQGFYSRVEPLYSRALEIRTKAFGPEHPAVSNSLNNLALFYSRQGRYAEAEPLYRQALSLRKQALGPDHPATANSYNNLAGLNKILGRTTEAEMLYREAVRIYKKQFGLDHPATANALSNLGSLYLASGQLEAGEALYRQALEIKEKTLGSDHPETAICLHNLARVLHIRENFTAAETLLNRALQICLGSSGPDHPDVANCMHSLGVVKAAAGQADSALNTLNRAFRINNMTIGHMLYGVPERVKLAFLNTIDREYDILLSLIFRDFSTDKFGIRTGLDATLQRKGLVAETMASDRLALVSSKDNSAAELMERLKSVSSRLAASILAGPLSASRESYQRSVACMLHQKDSLEVHLAALSRNYRNSSFSDRTDSRGVSRALGASDVLIEFAVYHPFDFRSGRPEAESEARYAAFMLRGDDLCNPILADLGPVSRIDSAVADFRKVMGEAAACIQDQGMGEACRRINRRCRALYERIYVPMAEYLPETGRFYFVPDGQLNLIPFEVLQTPEGVWLGEQVQVHYLSSGRDLMKLQEANRPQEGKVVILAAPDFNAIPAGTGRLTNGIVTPDELRNGSLSLRSGDLRQTEWPPLPGTINEARQIVRIMGKQAECYSGSEARETLVKKLKAPVACHIATHGFFLEDAPEPGGKIAAGPGRYSENFTDPAGLTDLENPLLRSGLILSGANRRGECESSSPEDGILTALEISALNFAGTDVVLSACETGLGVARKGEGVFGLRRAFQLAGARSVIMSLWKVPDTETGLLMAGLYRNMRRGMDRAVALREAKLAVMKDFLDRYGETHPMFWGAFICVE